MDKFVKFEQEEWQPFLRGWNNAFLRDVAPVDAQSFCEAYDNLRAPLSKKWLGEPGATCDEIEHAERALGATLPEDYRAFLYVTNGWTAPSFNKGRVLLPIREVDRFARKYPEICQVVLDCGVFPFADEHLEPVDMSTFRDIVALSDLDNNALLLFDPSSESRPFWHLDFHGPSSPFPTFSEMVLFAKERSDQSFLEVVEFQLLIESGGERAV